MSGSEAIAGPKMLQIREGLVLGSGGVWTGGISVSREETASDPGHLKGVPCGFGHILNARALARYFWIPVNSCNSSLQSHPGTPANFFFSDLLGEPSPFCTSCLSLLMDQQLWPPN